MITIINILFSIVLAGVESWLIKKNKPLELGYKLIKFTSLIFIYWIVAWSTYESWAWIFIQLAVYSLTFDLSLNLFRKEHPLYISETTSWPPERWIARLPFGWLIYPILKLGLILAILVNVYGWLL